MTNLYDINKMHRYARKELLEHVVAHFRNNIFFTSENESYRRLESNKIRVTWYSGDGCEYTITSKVTDLGFRMCRSHPNTDPIEDQFADDISKLYRFDSDWTAMKEKKFNEEFFGWKD